jgi:octaprenyl-diphosphate synthase
MADDLFDYTLETSEFGKEVGADLREGKLTLPLIYALKQAPSGDRDIMIKIIQDPQFSEADFKTLTGLLEKYGGLTYTHNTATSFIDTAKKALAVFDPSATKDTMLDIADYVLNRSV